VQKWFFLTFREGVTGIEASFAPQSLLSVVDFVP
jgi:hypothetical protein